MRSFTNFDNVNVVHPDIQLTVTANDSSQVFTFGRNAINFMSDVKWEMPFFGGIAKSLNYDIELLLGLDNIKNILRFLPGGLSELKITINSNDFYPHIGRVRGIQRDTPDTLKLTIFDRFFDSKLFFPKELITDSFATPHLEELLSGYPVYYGKHTRPFYHTAIDSDIARLLGPRNISSENHVSSIFFNSDFEKGDDFNLENNILVNKLWNQQSGDTNFINGGLPFEIFDGGSLEARFWEINETNQIRSVFINVVSDATLDITDKGYVEGAPQLFSTVPEVYQLSPIIKQKISQEILQATKFNFAGEFQNIGGGEFSAIRLFVIINSGDGTIVNTLAVGSGNTLQFNSDISSSNARFLFEGHQRQYYRFILSGSETATNPVAIASVQLAVRLKSEGYRNFSIFSPIVESSDIAISENPFAIIDDIASNHLSIEYLQNQSSDSQVDVQSFNFQCFFKERQEVKKIFDDFGRITDVNMWIGDSGILNFRTFKEDNNEVVNTSLDLSDIETINITEAPIGSSVFEQDLSSKIKVKYNFDFQKNEFQNTKVADRNNTPECNSLDARDITNETERETEYILEEDTASYYLGNLVRKFARGSEFINITGGVDLFPMELGDVFHLQHPMLINSVGNYQIIKLNANYLSGKINITAGKLDG